jgi:hypothetical protein
MGECPLLADTTPPHAAWEGPLSLHSVHSSIYKVDIFSGCGAITPIRDRRVAKVVSSPVVTRNGLSSCLNGFLKIPRQSMR